MIIMKRNVTHFKYARADRGGVEGGGGRIWRQRAKRDLW